MGCDMQVDLNGMEFHLSIRSDDESSDLLVEIIDEAMELEALRASASRTEGVAEILKVFSGINPDEDVCARIEAEISALATANSVLGASCEAADIV